jgi:SAM-dependent methyltransferase
VTGSAAAFVPESSCWICGSTSLTPVHEAIFELSIYKTQDPELSQYTGARVTLMRCEACGFAQPQALPALEHYFDRMYDQRWSREWIEAEFESPAKDFIFKGILDQLASRLPASRRRLLDVGAHAGRFVHLARQAGWTAEGLELNPQTAVYAATRTGAPIHSLNVHQVKVSEATAFDAVTITDVLEHIPHPARVLQRISALLAPGGWIAVKVPAGPAQLRKEAWRARLRPGYRATVADNLVHVSHFSPRALAVALERAGFVDVDVKAGAPELHGGAGMKRRADHALRLALYTAGRVLPGGVHLPVTLNLQAYARVP